MFTHVGLVVNPEKPRIFEIASRIAGWLSERGAQVFALPAAAHQVTSCRALTLQEMRQTVNLVITLGGDGTLFRAARQFAPFDIPLIGINLGGLGFLTEIPLTEFEAGLSDILEQHYRIEKRLMLETAVRRKGTEVKRLMCLNDVVIGKCALPRIIALKTFVNDELITTYSADGLIISTATGSTAYSLSAGGPVVHPSLNVFIVSPICAHTLAVRPVILRPDQRVKVILEPPAPEVLLTIDGQEAFPLQEKDIITVHRAPCQTSLVRLHRTTFFTVLRTKLGWRGVSYKNLRHEAHP